MIRTLLKQLLCSLDSIPRELEKVYDDCSCSLKNPDKGFLTSQLISVAEKYPTVFIVLDALDECSKETFEDVITLIHRLKNSGIKVFCTFRPVFPDLGNRLSVLDIHTISAHEEDVRNYLLIQLSKKGRYNKNLTQKIIDRLAQGAEGK